MNKRIVALLFSLSLPFFSFAEFQHELGLGFHYWTVVDDIDSDDIDEDGVATVIAYQLDGGLLAIHAELEIFPEDFGGAPERVYAPQILALLGETIYAGVGVGSYYTDGEFADEPFYLVRAGLNLGLFGPIALDVNANYYFSDFSSFNESDIDTDTVTLGVMARIEL